MLNKNKLIPLLLCSGFVLQGCNSSGDEQKTANAPKQMTYIGEAAYANITASPTAAAIFAGINASVVGAGGTGELCDVTINRMSYDTVGGQGEAATSSGVMMIPRGDSELCSGARPVVLYAHGTNSDSNYDLSQFALDPTNPATNEAVLLLASYASQGYVVVAPNYAGYSDSNLGYHPYLDEVQQSTEMMDALEHAREFAGVLGTELSSDLFVSGLSQGGYVAMATHKALEAKGETVTASMPISGPYSPLGFIDTVFAGFVNGASTTFAPLYLTALDRVHDIFDEPSEVYAEQYADFADNALPRPGGFDEAGLPDFQLFSGLPPAGANGINALGFGEDHLLADSFRTSYLIDAETNPEEPESQVRALLKESDMRDWQPAAPLLMCGAGNDPVVYHALNSDKMADFWSDLVAVGSVINLDLTDTPVFGNPFAPVQTAWQASNIDIVDVHAQTSVFCSSAGLSYFNGLKGS